jgi:hypothetical protein
MFKRLLLGIVFALLPAIGMAQTPPPQSVVKAFYTWYIPYGREEDTSKNDWAIADDKIFEFVDPLAVKQIRAGYTACGDEVCPGFEADYFLKAQDRDEKGWLKHMIISKPLYSGNKAIVAIQMRSSRASNDDMRNHLIVILKKIGKRWLITDVADAKDRQE